MRIRGLQQRLLIAILAAALSATAATLWLEQRSTSLGLHNLAGVGLLAAVALGLALGISWLLSRSLNKPVLELLRATEEIGSGHFGAELPSQRNDELGALARAVQLMASRLEHQAKERREAHEALTRLSDDMRVARDEARAAVEAKSHFLQNVTHELRTPMNGIIGMITLLLDSDLGPEEREFATVVHHSAERLLLLIDDILDYDKIVEGDLEVVHQQFDLRSCVTGAADRHQRSADEQGVALHVSLDPEIPAQLIGDSQRIAQVLHHLIDNAIKFTHEGQIQVTVRAGSAAEDPRPMEFQVTDSGVGIAADDVAGIFDRFTQVNDTASRGHGGTGIGLALCRELVQRMGGNLTVTSTLGVGTSFAFTLPLGAVQREPHRDVQEAHTSVLIVETSPATRRATAHRFLRAGCRVHSESTSAETIRACEAQDFDLVLIDAQLPDADGPTTADLLRQMPTLSDEARIILLVSDSAGASTILKDHPSISEVVAKPILTETVHGLLESRRAIAAQATDAS